jgi:two-component system phosphate regulon sensor histidine kinase PhoR
MLSFLLLPWILFVLRYIALTNAILLTALIILLLIPIFFLVDRYRKTVQYHTETLRLIYSRFQDENLIQIPEDIIERRKLILNHIDDILHHLNTTILDIESYRMRLRAILDALPLGIILLNDSEEISYINERAKTIFHLTQAFIHKTLESIDIPLQLISNVSHFKKEGYFNQEYDFEQRTYQMRIQPVQFKKQTDKPYTLITLDDISLEKSTERMKKDFFSYASHELKSPITAIKGYTELIQLNMVKENEYDQALGSIIKQADFMNRLVEDMLMLSRLEDMSEFKETLIEPHHILDAVLETLDPLSREKNIRILKDVHIFSGYFDPMDLNKLFKNLIENSIKYSESDKEIEIKLYQKENMMIFHIKDQGSGIEERHQTRIFERFYRIEKDRPFSGTGLGLAIVKHIVLKYKGVISLESKVKLGTTIIIKIPLKAKV